MVSNGIFGDIGSGIVGDHRSIPLPLSINDVDVHGSIGLIYFNFSSNESGLRDILLGADFLVNDLSFNDSVFIHIGHVNLEDLQVHTVSIG